MKTRLVRLWINQPSTLQPDHEYHGTNVWADEDEWDFGEEYLDVWLSDANVHSMRIARSSLSRGWTETSLTELLRETKAAVLKSLTSGAVHPKDVKWYALSALASAITAFECSQ